jgi:hypothetical protein
MLGWRGASGRRGRAPSRESGRAARGSRAGVGAQMATVSVSGLIGWARVAPSAPRRRSSGWLRSGARPVALDVALRQEALRLMPGRGEESRFKLYGIRLPARRWFEDSSGGRVSVKRCRTSNAEWVSESVTETRSRHGRVRIERGRATGAADRLAGASGALDGAADGRGPNREWVRRTAPKRDRSSRRRSSPVPP